MDDGDAEDAYALGGGGGGDGTRPRGNAGGDPSRAAADVLAAADVVVDAVVVAAAGPSRAPSPASPYLTTDSRLSQDCLVGAR